jgi:hypothetical protein
VNDATPWVSWSELESLLDADTVADLRPYLTHTGLDGQPCVDADRLQDLLGLLEQEDQTEGLA